MRDAVTGSDVVEQQVREEVDLAAIEHRIPALRRDHHRNVAACAAGRREEPFTANHVFVDRATVEGRQEFHERFEGVDAAQSGEPFRAVFGIGGRIAEFERFGVDAGGDFFAEQVVGDTHLVAVGVGAKREQRGVLRFPAESADSLLTSADVGDHRRPSADTVAVPVVGVFAGPNRLIRDGFDQTGAEQWDWDAPRDDIRFRRDLWLAFLVRKRKKGGKEYCRRER